MKNQTKRAVTILLLVVLLGSVIVTSVSASSKEKKGYCVDLEQMTLDNTNFRHVLYSGYQTQLVLMSLKPNEDIGMESHQNIDQIFYFMEGTGKCIVNSNEYEVSEGYVLFVPANSQHNIINTGDERLQIFTTYSPPRHLDGLVCATKEEAEATKEKFIHPTEWP